MPIYDPPIRLQGHQGRTTATLQGWKAIGLGLPFQAAGILLVLTGTGKLFPELQPHEAPWLLTTLGPVFFWVGTIFLIQGIQDLRRWHERTALQQSFPSEPWRWDYHWDIKGIKAGTVGEVVKTVHFGIFLVLFLVPFNWWAFLSGVGDWFVQLLAGLFDLITIGIFAQALYQFIQLVKYGAHRVDFDGFPFLLGGRLNVRLEYPERLKVCRSLTITLRCIQERYEVSGSGENRSIWTYCYQLYSDTRTLSPDELQSLTEPFFSIQFDLPQGDYCNRLAERPPRYWELEIKGDAPGANFSATYLMPVYNQ